MATTLTGTASLDSWDEDPPFQDAPLPRLAAATVTLTYEGDLVGTSTTRSAMRYAEDGAGESLGYEEFTGTLGGDEGSFVLRQEARFTADHSVEVTFAVVEGSGTGKLAGISGRGSYVTTGQTWTWSLDVDR